METLVSEGDGGSPMTFGPGRRIGLRGAAILRLSSDATSYEPTSARIDPGPTADEWADPVR